MGRFQENVSTTFAAQHSIKTTSEVLQGGGLPKIAVNSSGGTW